ncbi:MAG: metal-dependent transcriptional regulator [Planctomycetota bacterium]|nr:MAG: metal-dependent transcriptional regulator [Planctomycetota bacterium]
MPSLTVENYLKAMLQIGIREQCPWISTGRLARALSVSPGTVTTMLKSLSEGGLVEYVPYRGAQLTPAGRRLATRILRRHRLLELFLVRTLDLTWDQVHDEAENMEHAVSDFLVDRIDEFLGFPTIDPHGDPIPNPDGSMRSDNSDSRLLSECPGGSAVRVVRVLNQDQQFLRFLATRGIGLGTRVQVTAQHDQSVTVRVPGADTFPLPVQAAESVLVEICDDH